MKLPCPNNVIIGHEKIAGYLLNLEHRYGATKARFFIALGFSVDEWTTLADALRELGVPTMSLQSARLVLDRVTPSKESYQHLLVLRLSSVRFGSSTREELLRA